MSIQDPVVRAELLAAPDGHEWRTVWLRLHDSAKAKPDDPVADDTGAALVRTVDMCVIEVWRQSPSGGFWLKTDQHIQRAQAAVWWLGRDVAQPSSSSGAT